jgi:hypothetical protein
MYEFLLLGAGKYQFRYEMTVNYPGGLRLISPDLIIATKRHTAITCSGFSRELIL